MQLPLESLEKYMLHIALSLFVVLFTGIPMAMSLLRSAELRYGKLRSASAGLAQSFGSMHGCFLSGGLVTASRGGAAPERRSRAVAHGQRTQRSVCGIWCSPVYVYVGCCTP